MVLGFVEESSNALGKSVASEREAAAVRGRADVAAKTTEARYAPAAGSYREGRDAEIVRTADELAYWGGVRAAQIADGVAAAYSREVIAVGDLVRYAGHVHQVLRVNAESVTIGSTFGGSWTGRVPYSEIRGLYDTDGNVVRIVDGARVTETAA